MLTLNCFLIIFELFIMLIILRRYYDDLILGKHYGKYIAQYVNICIYLLYRSGQTCL